MSISSRSHLLPWNTMLKNSHQVHSNTSAQYPCPRHLWTMPHPPHNPPLPIPPLGFLLTPALDHRLRSRGLCIPPAILPTSGWKPVQSHQFRHPILLHRRRTRLPLSRHLHNPHLADRCSRPKSEPVRPEEETHPLFFHHERCDRYHHPGCRSGIDW